MYLWWSPGFTRLAVAVENFPGFPEGVMGCDKNPLSSTHTYITPSKHTQGMTPCPHAGGISCRICGHKVRGLGLKSTPRQWRGDARVDGTVCVGGGQLCAWGIVWCIAISTASSIFISTHGIFATCLAVLPHAANSYPLHTYTACSCRTPTLTHSWLLVQYRPISSPVPHSHSKARGPRHPMALL